MSSRDIASSGRFEQLPAAAALKNLNGGATAVGPGGLRRLVFSVATPEQALQPLAPTRKGNQRLGYLRDCIGVMLGGVSEKVVLGEVSSGAGDDLKQAHRLAGHMVGLGA